MINKITTAVSTAIIALLAASPVLAEIEPPPPMPSAQDPAAEPPIRDYVPKPSEAFTPHRIVYTLELTSLSPSANIRKASGKMYFEWADACDAWTTTQKVQITYLYNDGQTVPISSDYKSWESKDGASYAFTVQELEDKSYADKVRGNAFRNDDASGKASYVIPADLAQALPKGFKFPSAHTFELLRRSKAGERFFTSTLFDGSDEEGPMLVNAVIGPIIARPEQVAEMGENKLIDSPARRVRLAYYEPSSPSSTPDYEMSVMLHDNGVVSDMVIDYPDFSIRAVPQDLKALDKSGC